MHISKSGIYRDFPTARYFQDPCPEPSLTQSLAKILIERSPLHAYQAHPRLNVQISDEDEGYDKAKAIGNAAHAMMLQRGKELAIGSYDDWRTKEAKAFKAEALAAGREPILQKHADIAASMVAAAVDQLRTIDGCDLAFRLGSAEVVIANCEDGIWLRSMLDWITPDLREVWDMKTGAQSASPWSIGRRMVADGWDIQGAMHERILDVIDPAGAGRRRFFYVALENTPPYGLTVNELSEAVLTMGRKKIDYAIRVWRQCIKKNMWPAYPPMILRPEYPVYAESSWLEREVHEHDVNLLMAG